MVTVVILIVVFFVLKMLFGSSGPAAQYRALEKKGVHAPKSGCWG